MSFDIIRFLEQHRIQYWTHGVNIKRVEINIICPFCAKTASPDPSYHLGIDPERMWFSCWRNRKQHCGKSLHRLLMALLKCSYFKVCELLGTQPLWLNAEKFENLTFDEAPETVPTELVLPKEFRDQWDHSSAIRFQRYLIEDRGFPPDSIFRLAARYQLYYSISGRDKDRIVIPNRINGRLVNWTSRSIHPHSRLRYLTLDKENGALINIKQHIFNVDSLQNGGSVLMVVEGPFDALKVDFYGARLGVRATCLFNKKSTLNQLGYLGELANVFNRIMVMFDQGEELDQQDLLSQLSWLPEHTVAEWSCPSHVKDPGELTPNGVRQMCTQLIEKLL